MTDTEASSTAGSATTGVGATDAAGFDPAELHFVTGRVSDTEVSAVTALVRVLLQEESDELRVIPVGGQTAWQRSQRSIRTPVVPGHGHWRSFPA